MLLSIGCITPSAMVHASALTSVLDEVHAGFMQSVL
jgi:hypothetical protein